MLSSTGNKMERWSIIKGYEGRYEVSDSGVIRSLKWKSKNINRYYGGQILKCKITRFGYYEATLYSENKTPKIVRKCRIVAEAFLGESNGLHVNHKNSNKLDDSLENLEYVTQRENTQHAYRKNTSDGKMGIMYTKNGKWRARKWMNGRSRHLGYFSTRDEASAAYERA
jgi:hypothetical protein